MSKEITYEEYFSIIEGWLEGWNTTNVEKVVSFYTDNFDYKDPSLPNGVNNKKDFINYLNQLFTIWPEQKWVMKEVYAHKEKGKFSATYDFKFGNNKTEVDGFGIDLIEFEGNLIKLNHVFLNPYKFREWIKYELTKT